MNPDALDAAIAEHANRWYNRGCAIGKMIADLPVGPYRTKLVGYMNQPVDRIGHSAIIAAIKDTLDVDIRGDALLRHRARRCSCSDEVYG
jgi:hypothetical protein